MEAVWKALVHLGSPVNLAQPCNKSSPASQMGQLFTLPATSKFLISTTNIPREATMSEASSIKQEEDSDASANKIEQNPPSVVTVSKKKNRLFLRSLTAKGCVEYHLHCQP